MNQAILYPVFALAAWTFLVLLLIPFHRFRAAARGLVTAEDFSLGESAKVPSSVSLPNRNYMNLLELPLLFYVVCLLLAVTDGAGRAELALAWVFVGLRVVHSLVHFTYNNVYHRLATFALSSLALMALWVCAFVRLG